MESPDHYNFSLFTPRNLHGRKNRNVILTMLLIWATAVFGFQILLKTIEKPTPERTLTVFDERWPEALSNDLKNMKYTDLLNSVVLVKGKNIVKPDHQETLNAAISCITFSVMPDSLQALVKGKITDMAGLKINLGSSNDQEFLNLKSAILSAENTISEITSPFTGLKKESLENKILTASLRTEFPKSLSDASLSSLPQIMSLYLTHNQSVLTDTKFLGFPFHYFYTAVFLLILFVCLCIVYNLLVEWRLNKEGISE